MLKQSILLVAISIVIILSMSYAKQGIEMLLYAHDWISQLLTDVFTVGQAGNLVRELITLLSIPLIAGFIPALVYWGIKRHFFPYFMQIVWIVWLIQVGALIVMYKVAV